MPPQDSPKIEDKRTNGDTLLILTYLKDGTSIRVSKAGATVLGRAGVGAELFSRIRVGGSPVVSKLHCSIDFHNNSFFVQDLGSRNGTFLGARMVDCLPQPMEIKDNDLLFIGREVFRAHVERPIEEASFPREEVRYQYTKTPQPAPGNVKFRCNDCGREFDERPAYCEACGRADGFIMVQGRVPIE